MKQQPNNINPKNITPMKKLRQWICMACMAVALLLIGLAAKAAPDNELEKAWEDLNLF